MSKIEPFVSANTYVPRSIAQARDPVADPRSNAAGLRAFRRVPAMPQRGKGLSDADGMAVPIGPPGARRLAPPRHRAEGRELRRRRRGEFGGRLRRVFVRVLLFRLVDCRRP